MRASYYQSPVGGVAQAECPRTGGWRAHTWSPTATVFFHVVSQGATTGINISLPRSSVGLFSRSFHCATPRCSSNASSTPPPLHLDPAGAEVLELLQLHFDGCKDMRLVAMYGSAAFKQISENAAPPAEVGTGKTHTEVATGAATSSSPSAELAETPMLDLIFAVDDPMAFHARNMRRHPAHYNSFLRHLSWIAPPLIGALQEWSAGVWYNTLIDLPVLDPPGGTRLIKYGVISTKRLVQDLTEWDTLYIAGRMHKPVSSYFGGEGSKPASNNWMFCVVEMHMLICAPEIQEAANANLRQALATAVLLLDDSEAGVDSSSNIAAGVATSNSPPLAVPSLPSSSSSSSSPSSPSSYNVTLRALLTRICSLSYFGDIRMGVAENPDKVANIVTGSWDQLVSLYKPHVQKIAMGTMVAHGGPKGAKDVIQFPCDVETRARMLASLPASFQREIRLHDKEAAGVGVPHLSLRDPNAAATSPSAIDPYWHSLALRPAAVRKALLTASLGAIVARSSKQQTMKGLATAGVRKSFRYGMAKLRKALRK